MINLRRIRSISRLSLACLKPMNSVAAENHLSWLNRHSPVPRNSLINPSYLFKQTKIHPLAPTYCSLTIKNMSSFSTQKELSQADADYIKKLEEQAEFYSSVEDYEEAIKVLMLIIELFLKNGQTGFGYAWTLIQIGQCYKHFEKYIDALDYYKRAIKVLDSLEDNHEDLKATIQAIIGNILIFQQKYDQAEKLLLKCAQVLRQTSKRFELCNVLGFLGQINQEKKKYEEATRFFATQYIQFLNQYQLKGQNTEMVIDCFVRMSSCFIELGKYMQALDFCMRAKYLYESEGQQKSNQYAINLVKISQIYRSLNSHQQSFEYILKAVPILQQNMGKDNPDLLPLFLKLGLDYYKREKQDQAFDYLQRSRSIMSNSQQIKTYEISYKELIFIVASLHRYKKKYSEALKYYHQALDFQLKDGQITLAAINLRQIGDTYFQIQDFTSSIDFYLRLLDMYKKEKGENSPQNAWILQKIAVIYNRMGKEAESLTFAEMAKSLCKNQANPENK